MVLTDYLPMAHNHTPKPIRFRENSDGTVRCPHRDLTVCHDCVDDEQIYEVYALHFLVPEGWTRDEVVAYVNDESVVGAAR